MNKYYFETRKEEGNKRGIILAPNVWVAIFKLKMYVGVLRHCSKASQKQLRRYKPFQIINGREVYDKE